MTHFEKKKKTCAFTFTILQPYTICKVEKPNVLKINTPVKSTKRSGVQLDLTAHLSTYVFYRTCFDVRYRHQRADYSLD